jgi:hypothetical protein
MNQQFTGRRQLMTSQGQRTLTPFDTKDLQQELPIPATGFAFHYEAHLPWMLLQQ